MRTWAKSLISSLLFYTLELRCGALAALSK